jgi:proteasome beta subunit
MGEQWLKLRKPAIRKIYKTPYFTYTINSRLILSKMDAELKGHVVKTGTTTLGIVCKDGIVVAADKRGTYGGDSGVSYIAGWDQEKIEEVTPEIIVTTAGVASDTRKVIKIVRAELKLKELRSKSKPTINQAANLFASMTYQNIRQPSMIMSIAHFILAGYDSEGVHLYNIHADGFLEEEKKYTASGSGLMQVNPILDSEYKDNMSVDEGIKLAKRCINASMNRDPATGDGMDMYVVKSGEIKKLLSQRVERVFRDQ